MKKLKPGWRTGTPSIEPIVVKRKGDESLYWDCWNRGGKWITQHGSIVCEVCDVEKWLPLSDLIGMIGEEKGGI